MLSICKQLMETNFDEIGVNDKTINDEYHRILNISMDGVELDNVSRLNRLIYIYIAPIIIGIGIVGDLLTIATLTHPSLKRKDIYIFLTFLAVTDLLAQLSLIPPILWILDYRFCSSPAAIYYAHIAFPLANALMGASVWVVVLLTLYQFRAVCYPLRSSTAQMDRRFVYCLFALSFFANFCIYAPWAFKKIIYQIPPGVLRCPLVICDRNMDTPWFRIYEWVREFLTRLLPFVLIAYFNVNILITYRTNKKDRLSLSSQSFHRKAVVEKSEKEEKRLFTVLFAITVIFFLCTIPAAPVTIFISDRQSQSLPFQIFRSASNLLEITKFALNFYLYCLINPDIRRVCLRVLKCNGWTSLYERVSSGHTLRTIPSMPNSRAENGQSDNAETEQCPQHNGQSSDDHLQQQRQQSLARAIFDLHLNNNQQPVFRLSFSADSEMLLLSVFCLRFRPFYNSFELAEVHSVLSQQNGQFQPRSRIALVIFGAVMIHLSIGTYHTFGNMLPYMASYMRNFTDPSVKIEHLIWVPTFQGCFPLAMVIGGFLSQRVGPRLAAAIGCYTMCLGVLLSSWTIRHSYYGFLFTYGLMFGLGQGIAYVIAVSCVINWAPQMVGLGSGIVAAGFGISSSIFAPIQTRIVNPNNVAANKDGYFNDQHLLSRVPGLFVTLATAYFFMQCIGLLFICDPPDEFVRRFLSPNSTSLIDMAWLSKKRSHWLAANRSPLLSSGWATAKMGLQRMERFGRYQYARLATAAEQEEDSDEEQKRKKSESGSNEQQRHLTNSFPTPPNESDETAEEEDDELDIGKQGPPISLSTRQMLRSSTFYFLFISLFCCSFYGNFFYNLYKTFGETFIEDDFFLAFAFSLGSVANAIARVGWGLLTDRTSFQTSLCMATSLATVLLLTMPMTALSGRYVYLLWLVLMFVCLAATHALFITAIVRCFGSVHKIVNYGCLIFSTTLSGIALAIGSEFFLQSIGYNWAFLGTAAFPFVAFLLTSAIRITPQGHLIVSK
ncbi:hypothetical protein niasHS_014822 [Heterodera schachtii]|uniref:G-protein coupled receptors family 1 profile domain-containing protein n=1 Tax=Heterodera schachtii TaxID=97005 RepID=A0ABD2IMI3_HETSC